MDILTFFHNFISVFEINIVTVLAAIAIIILYSYSGTPKNLPPGPYGLPILGYLPFLGKAPHEAFNTLSKKYGPVISLYLGNRLVVVLNHYDAIKEALVKQGDAFIGRPDLQVSCAETDIYKITTADGEIWKTHRRFALNIFKDLGLGKTGIESQIMEEIQYFVNEVKKLNGQPTKFADLLFGSVSNNICILIFGKRFEYDDPWFILAKRYFNEYATQANVTGLAVFFPWLLKLPGIAKIGNQQNFLKLLSEFKESVLNQITEWKKSYMNGQRDNYINAFIGEQIAEQKNDKKDMMFPDKALEENIRGLMGAGTETTGNTLLWCLLYMTLHPDVQRKVQNEIDDVIGRERAPCWNDRLRTPYTEATIFEVQRLTTLVPTSVPRKNIKECQIFGYTIPKDTFIVANLWAVHNDDKLWENVQSFRPDRFLNANGEILRNEHLCTFSMGKRDCLGVSLAKMELYLYFATMLQMFTFRSQDGSTPSLEPRKGVTYGPKQFNIMAVKRDTVKFMPRC